MQFVWVLSEREKGFGNWRTVRIFSTREKGKAFDPKAKWIDWEIGSTAFDVPITTLLSNYVADLRLMKTPVDL